MFSDGTSMDGEGFGADGVAYGEAVFNTGMTGYVESLTDPSYAGQILALTYPLVGNYGVPARAPDADGIPAHFESDRVQPRALVVHELCRSASHWAAADTLDGWLHSEGVPGVSGIDTRALASKLREEGVGMAAVAVSPGEIDGEEVARGLSRARAYADSDLVPGASAGGPRRYGRGGRTVALVDLGAKNAILRSLLAEGLSVVRLPWDSGAGDIMSHSPDGVVFSNGPGDPERCAAAVAAARGLAAEGVPTLGICLGAQVMGLAGGARTYKLKYGHRGQNKPCVDVGDGRVYVTSQNHGYCIDPESLGGSAYGLWFRNADDGTVEGIRGGSSIAVQFHPEASPGPSDCGFVFRRLGALMRGGGDAGA